MNADHAKVIEAAADRLWDTVESYDLDPDNSLAIVRQAYLSSDCDDFSWVLSRMTGWEVVQATWEAPGHTMGHHTMVKSPDGRLLDVIGWTDEQAAAKRYRKPESVRFSNVPQASPLNDLCDADVNNIIAVIRALPDAPFQDEAFHAESRLLEAQPTTTLQG